MAKKAALDGVQLEPLPSEVLDLWSPDSEESEQQEDPPDLQECEELLQSLRSQVLDEVHRNSQDRPLFCFLRKLVAMEPHRMKDYIRRCDEGCDPSAVDECGPRQQLPQVWSFAVKPKREFLAYVLLVTSEYVEKMPDPRRGRESEKLDVLQRRFSHDGFDFSTDLSCFEYLLSYAADLALEHRRCKQGRIGAESPGVQVLQRMLVLSECTAQLRIVHQLMHVASQMLYHDSGCFVVSQILQAALDAHALRCYAHNFMLVAHGWYVCHDNVLSFCQNLLLSMTHKHANHSFQMWVSLLFARVPQEEAQEKALIQESQGPILGVIRENAATLAVHHTGCRVVNSLLTSSVSREQLQPVLDRLLASNDQLDTFMEHPFANHTVQYLVCFEYDRVAELVCGSFSKYANDDFANYVVQACIKHCGSETWLQNLSEAFLDAYRADTLQPQRSICMRRAFERLLERPMFASDRKKAELVGEVARRLEAECPMQWFQTRKPKREMDNSTPFDGAQNKHVDARWTNWYSGVDNSVSWDWRPSVWPR